MMRGHHEQGQGLVEFALVFPIFIFILVAIFDLGHVVWSNDALSNAAREAARYAIVHGGAESTACPVGPPATTALVPPASADCPHPAPSKQSIRDVAIHWARSAGLTVNVYVCYGNVAVSAVQACDNASADDSADSDLLAGATDARGQQVTVLVTSNVRLVMPSFFGMRAIGLQASSTMLVNH